ncbi:MAG TPA: TetR family transcriptional regulator [Gaiellales bacterium]|nr:TetR family transcriptional regulator [Gaiellales bacterium]
MSDRRGVLLEAALRVIARSGVDAATHRAVAAEASVALASTTYHFTSKSDLIRQALELVIERSTASVAAHSAPPGPDGAEALVERLVALAEALASDQRAPLTAQYELLLEAGRRAELRPLAERWNDAYMAGIVAMTIRASLPRPELAAEVLSNVIEGGLLNQLALPRPGFVRESMAEQLRAAVAGLGEAGLPPHAG